MRLEGLHEIRAELVGRLRGRFAEIEASVIDRVQKLAEPPEGDDPEYRVGVRATVAEALDYALLAMEHGEEWEGSIPPAAITQAHRAARSGTGLDTVLRRYAAGDRLVGEFIMEETADLPHEATREVLRSQSSHIDRLMEAVAAEYMNELELMRRSPSQRNAERVQRLLAGDAPADAAALGYEFDAWHLGLIVIGPRPDVAARTLAAGLGCQPLVVVRGDEAAWAWLGGGRRLPVAEIERYMGAGVLGDLAVSAGEPRHGLDGWRLTHHEAKAAQRVMTRQQGQLTRASEVVLLAAVVRDEMLARSLHETYLAPLDERSDAGPVLRETLRAYFDAGFNAATAAAVLQVDRHTVQRRLRKVEEALGRLLHTCHAEIEVALLLEGLELGQFGKAEAGPRTQMAHLKSGSR
jgi:PucR C-terminal helix-turn-helix domain/GGDEF-like domain